ncbi:MAG TPA: hypothetical protein VFA76_09600 [Terriglobales bacterium]|nr:hypothetical protein [Terriglobales bacterium]
MSAVLVLRESEIRRLLDPAACVQAVEEALAAYSSGKAELPAVIGLDIPEHRGEIHIKAGHLHGGSHYAVKIASGFPENTELGISPNGGMVLVFDAMTGAPAAFLLDNGFITDLRTAAAGAVAAKHLARKEIHSVAVIGSGGQARYQTELIYLVREFREVKVWGRDPGRTARCVDDLKARFQLLGNDKGISFRTAGSAREAAAGADLVVTTTASRRPLVQAEWLKAGALIIAVGSDAPDKQELEVDVLARADRIIADSIPQCIRLGEIHHALEAGAISKEKICAELGEIASSGKPGRRTEQEIIVCDLTGVGVQDVASAALVLARARAAGVGERLQL